MSTKKITVGANPTAMGELKADLRDTLLNSTRSPHFMQIAGLTNNRFVLANLAPRGDLSVAQEKTLIFADANARRCCRHELDITDAIPRLSKAEAWSLISCIFSRMGVQND